MFFGVGVGIDAEHQLIVVHGGESAEQTVPDRENVPVIRVGVRQHVVVVHTVHPGRYDDPTERLVEPPGELDVRVVELCKNH